MGAGNASAAAYEAWRGGGRGGGAAGGIAADASTPSDAGLRKRAVPAGTAASMTSRATCSPGCRPSGGSGEDTTPLSRPSLQDTAPWGTRSGEPEAWTDPPTLGSARGQQHMADGAAAAGTVDPARRAHDPADLGRGAQQRGGLATNRPLRDASGPRHRVAQSGR